MITGYTKGIGPFRAEEGQRTILVFDGVSDPIMSFYVKWKTVTRA